MADVVITAANVLKVSGATVERGTAGATITAGQLVYKDSSDSNKYKLADANGAAALNVVVGIALNGASSGQPLEVLTAGLIDIGGTITVGGVYVASATAGGIAPVADLVSGWKTSVIGIGTTAARMQVSINNSNVAVP